MFIVRLAGDHLFTWLSCVFDGVLFCAVLFPRDVLDEIWNLIESVPENFSTYSQNVYIHLA